MNIILIGRGLSKPRSFNITRPHILAIFSICCLVVVISLLTAGYQVGRIYGADARHEHILMKWGDELAEQRTELDASRQHAEDHMNALALRLGELQGQMLRINALGERLTHMAKLDDGEFDFSEPPALGGPELEASMPALTIPGFDDAIGALKQRLNTQEEQFTVLADLLLHRDLEDRRLPAGRPVRNGWISSLFGNRIDPFTGRAAFHSGIDFAGRRGSDVLAVAGGVVTFSGRRSGYGNLVEIDHGNGYKTRYGHCQENLVKVGDRVKQGQVIGKMGATGRATAPNVHLEVVLNGKLVNPVKYVRSLR